MKRGMNATNSLAWRRVACKYLTCICHPNQGVGCHRTVTWKRRVAATLSGGGWWMLKDQARSRIGGWSVVSSGVHTICRAPSAHFALIIHETRSICMVSSPLRYFKTPHTLAQSHNQSTSHGNPWCNRSSHHAHEPDQVIRCSSLFIIICSCAYVTD